MPAQWTRLGSLTRSRRDAPDRRLWGLTVADALRIGGALFVGLGALLALGLTPNVRRWVAARSWPTTNGTITSSAVLAGEAADDYRGELLTGTDERANIGGTGEYVPRVEYEYRVDGIRYEGDRISWTDGAFSRRSMAATLVGQYPPGTIVELRYDPADPGEAVLRSTTRSNRWLLAVAAIGSAAFGGYVAAGYPAVSYLPLGVGAVVTAVGVWLLFRAVSARRWPTAPATLQSVGARESHRVDDGVRHGGRWFPTVEYTYRVDGATYVGHRLWFGGRRFDTADEARSAAVDAIGTNAAGATFAVRYDPENPDVATVEPGGLATVATYLLVGIGFLVGGSMIV